MKRVYLYGLADAAGCYRIVWHYYLEADDISIMNLKRCAAEMRLRNPTVDHVYAIDMKPGLAAEYKHAKKRNNIESNVLFKVMLEREGLMII